MSRKDSITAEDEARKLSKGKGKARAYDQDETMMEHDQIQYGKEISEYVNKRKRIVSFYKKVRAILSFLLTESMS